MSSSGDDVQSWTDESSASGSESNLPGTDEDVSDINEDDTAAPIRGRDYDEYFTLPGNTIKEWKKAVKDHDKNVWIRTPRTRSDGGVTYYLFCKMNRKKNFCPCPSYGKMVVNPGHPTDFFGFKLGMNHPPHILLNEAKPVFTDEVKEAVEQMVKLRVSPKDMVKQLAEEGHGKFTARQMSQLKNRIKKKLARLGTIPDPTFGTVDFVTWCTNNSTIPIDITKPFVIDFKCVSVLLPKFSMFMSNRFLLSKLDNMKCLQVDAAHKMIIGKHKVLVAGGSDAVRSFHPVIIGISDAENENAYTDMFKAIKRYNPNFNPEAVMADGAAYITNAIAGQWPWSKRLMCWFHMTYNVKKWFGKQNAKLFTKVKRMLQVVQKAHSLQEFGNLCQLLQNELPPEYNDFIDYFFPLYVNGPLAMWFEGFSGFVTTNNGLEAVNRVIKEENTDRVLHTIPSFIIIMKEIVASWVFHSKPFVQNPTSSPSVLTEAF